MRLVSNKGVFTYGLAPGKVSPNALPHIKNNSR